VMRSHSSLFSLGLEAELDECDQDVVDIWGPPQNAQDAP
jgi:hypothetical protein